MSGFQHAAFWAMPSGGQLAVYSHGPVPPHSPRPLVLLAHGALGHAALLAHWGVLLADVADTLFLDLPGHGRSDRVPGSTVAAMTDAVHGALARELPDRRVLAVGESLGGLVALGLGGRTPAGPVRAVLAADPPLTTTKQWSVREALTRAQDQLGGDFIAELAAGSFGAHPDGRLEEIVYYDLVANLRCPGAIVTGDTPLMPMRDQAGRITCLIDEVDVYVVNRLLRGRVPLWRIPGGDHMLMIEALAPMRERIAEMLRHPAMAG